MKAFLIGVTAAKLTSKDVRNSFQDTKHGISSYMTDVFDSQGDMSKDFDEFTRYGSMLEPGGSNGKIKEKLYPEVIKLFKKLNIRALLMEWVQWIRRFSMRVVTVSSPMP